MGARVIAVTVAAVAYVLVSHWLMTGAPASPWNAVVIVGPMLGAAALFAWQRRHRLLALTAALALAVLVVRAWRGDALPVDALYVCQHVAIHLLLALVFGLTLQPGREALITALARRVHGTLTPAMAAYSRRVTIVWTGYFLAMAALSLALYAAAPFDVWAAFANLVTPFAICAMFVGEYLVRYRLHPEFERATLAQAVRAYADRGSHD
ncbi:MAG TPA: hypothetical protein VLD35_19575 [Caldimonas sp.]|nr:hypothetical protein [Caldimonas sp.]